MNTLDSLLRSDQIGAGSAGRMPSGTTLIAAPNVGLDGEIKTKSSPPIRKCQKVCERKAEGGGSLGGDAVSDRAGLQQR